MLYLLSDDKDLEDISHDAPDHSADAVRDALKTASQGRRFAELAGLGSEIDKSD